LPRSAQAKTQDPICKITKAKEGWGVDQVVECLHKKQKKKIQLRNHFFHEILCQPFPWSSEFDGADCLPHKDHLPKRYGVTKIKYTSCQIM
jgi:hypothetical protein